MVIRVATTAVGDRAVDICSVWPVQVVLRARIRIASALFRTANVVIILHSAVPVHALDLF